MRCLNYFDICHCLLTVRRGNSRPPNRVAPRTCDSPAPQCARCWLAASRPLKATHLIHAEAAPVVGAGRADDVGRGGVARRAVLDVRRRCKSRRRYNPPPRRRRRAAVGAEQRLKV